MIQVVSPVSKPSCANAAPGINRKIDKKDTSILLRAKLDISPYLRVFVCAFLCAKVMPIQITYSDSINNLRKEQMIKLMIGVSLAINVFIIYAANSTQLSYFITKKAC